MYTVRSMFCWSLYFFVLLSILFASFLVHLVFTFPKLYILITFFLNFCVLFKCSEQKEVLQIKLHTLVILFPPSSAVSFWWGAHFFICIAAAVWLHAVAPDHFTYIKTESAVFDPNWHKAGLHLDLFYTLTCQKAAFLCQAHTSVFTSA